jgi:hypothetical protein
MDKLPSAGFCKGQSFESLLGEDALGVTMDTDMGLFIIVFPICDNGFILYVADVA